MSRERRGRRGAARGGDVLYALGPRGATPVPLRIKHVYQDSLSLEGGLHATLLAASPLVDSTELLRGVLVAGPSGSRIGRDTIAFTPLSSADAKKSSFMAPRATVTVSTTATPRLK